MSKRKKKKLLHKFIHSNFVPLFVVLLVSLILSVWFVFKQFAPATTQKEELAVLFVMRGDAVVMDDSIQLDFDVLEWFTDRPLHQAGLMTVDEFISAWQRGFKSSMPNAAIINDEIDVILELEEVRYVDDKLILSYGEIIRGDLGSGSIGEVSVYIEPMDENCLDASFPGCQP